MNLLVRVNGGGPVQFQDIDSWVVKGDGELHITRSGRVTAIVASGQWLYAEETGRSDNGGSPVRHPDRRLSNPSDLAYVEPAAVERARAASVQFAIDNLTVPWSEAHMRAVLDYEKLLAAEYGEDAVLNLPWRRIPRGSDR